MKTILLSIAAFVAVSCSGAERAPEQAVQRATLSLADVAGRWSAQAMSADGQRVLVSYTLSASEDPAGWILELPDRAPMNPRIQVDGDSIILTNGPYESVLNKGVMVTTNGILRLVDDKLVGTTVAHYAGPGIAPDSAVHLRIEATRER